MKDPLKHALFRACLQGRSSRRKKSGKGCPNKRQSWSSHRARIRRGTRARRFRRAARRESSVHTPGHCDPELRGTLDRTFTKLQMWTSCWVIDLRFNVFVLQMRSAIQALQILVSTSQRNTSVPTPTDRENRSGLTRCSSQPPDALCWISQGRRIDAATQTDWPLDIFEVWVRANPHHVLRILGIDPESLQVPRPPSPTPSPSSPPPPPYEPLSSIPGTPPQSPLQSNPDTPGTLRLFSSDLSRNKSRSAFVLSLYLPGLRYAMTMIDTRRFLSVILYTVRRFGRSRNISCECRPFFNVNFTPFSSLLNELWFRGHAIRTQSETEHLFALLLLILRAIES